MKPKKLAILVNLDAQQGNAAKLWWKIKQDVIEYFPENTEILTYNVPCDFQNQIKDLLYNKDVDGFISAGGDGSLNCLLNILLKLKKNISTPLYVGGIGLGSSNDFHKPFSTFIQKVPVKINWNKNQLSDVGKVEYEAVDGTRVSRYFMINASLGITAEANYMFNHPGRILDFLKRSWTDGAILFAALKAIFIFRNFKTELLIDNNIKKLISLSNLSVIKTPHISGYFKYEQRITFDDSFLGLNYCDGMNKMELLATLFGLTKGRFTTNSKRKSFKIKSLNLFSQNMIPIETDGEVSFGKNFNFVVIPKAIFIMG